MKPTTRLLTISALVALATVPALALPVGDNAELFVTGTAAVRSDSNIYLSSNKESDVIFDLAPGLEFDFGKGSAVTGTATFAESFSVYSDHSGLNASLAVAGINTAYEDGKTKVTFNASYAELNQNTVDVTGSGTVADALIRRNVFNIGGTGEVAVTEKTSVAGGLQYSNTDYRRTGFSDSTMLSIPLNFYYELTPKLDVGLGYRFRENWQQLLLDSRDHFVSLAARGDFTPKLTGTVNVGVTQRHFNRTPTTPGIDQNPTLLGVDANLSYAATPKMSVSLGVTNDFDTNAVGQQQKNLALRTGVNANFSEQWAFNGSIAYRSIDYYTRTDSYTELQAGLSYIVNASVHLTGAIAYRNNDSARDRTETTNTGADARSFDDTVFSLAANFRF